MLKCYTAKLKVSEAPLTKPNSRNLSGFIPSAV